VRLRVALVVLGLAVLATLYALHARRYEDTDDRRSTGT
jgi:hypothetical protein